MTKSKRSISQSWHMERRKKYRTSTGADQNERPPARSRSQCYVNPYTKKDGTKVRGHNREINRGWL